MASWVNTKLTTPNAAAIERTFMMTAFSGTSTDRNAISSRKNESSSTSAMTCGSLLAIWSARSM